MDHATTLGISNKGIQRFMRQVPAWLPQYLTACLLGPRRRAKRVWFAITDHFEPFWRGVDHDQARARVALWLQKWPEIARRHRDVRGRSPRYTFFYPEEQYNPWHLDALASLVGKGIADVEVHIHHDGEGEQNFTDRVSTFTERLCKRHGLLRKISGQVTFGFIHGNWALDNSRADGRWCGLNNEISLLTRLGCYADFTFPAVHSECQPRMINTIYWATDDPKRPKSYDYGTPVVPGGPIAGDLMLIPGPLGIYRATDRLMPRIENGELASHNPVTVKRVQTWLRVAPRLGNDIFIKLFAHGATEPNADALLNCDLDFSVRYLATECAKQNVDLYFVSAFEMWTVVNALRQRTNPVSAIETAQAAVH